MTRSNRWKGGRILDSNGYVLVWDPTHPLAMANGYVLEHRAVAAAALGRALRPGEQVHHRNEDRQDNRSENLEVLSHAEHRERHRRRADLRGVDEANPLVECACGCRMLVERYDARNRPRRFIHGHNRRAA